MKNATINTQAGNEPVALIDILVVLRFWCMIFNGNKFDWFGHALQYESTLKIVPCNMALKWLDILIHTKSLIQESQKEIVLPCEKTPRDHLCTREY